ncbi:hypothetical protein SNE26_19355 [Mucilaginibacter sp. cycad4]|uniref:hypothetical protein n=1 Tax=Mucilaginibacter sp. cycad4 TaxID=3342096 RepID=UPI002AAC136B|nr:hypothetical protein [Mucilaginibacter gossypii]WPU98184.1 hypothetical protein SNE26_19355 [Mucilaginibacter gossypii]
MTGLKKIFNYNKWQIAFIAVFTLTNSIALKPINAAPAKHVMAITAEIPLKAFEGIYQQKENEFRVYKVVTDGDKLVAQQLGGDQKLTLTRKSDLEFEFLDDDGDEKIPVVFSKNEAGEIAQITLGGRQIWTKIKSYTPPKEIQLQPEQIKVLAGKYQSDERADLFLTITAIPDGLTLKQSWDGKEINFKPLSDVLFLNQAFGFPLKFTKDASGNPVKVLAFNRDTWNKVKE